MFLEETDRDVNYPAFKLRSKGGKWEAGITPMLFGNRVRMGPADSPWCTLDYCCGEFETAIFWLGFITGVCLHIPEDISEHEFSKIFPRQNIKPLAMDKACSEALLSLADKFSHEPIVQ